MIDEDNDERDISKSRPNQSCVALLNAFRLKEPEWTYTMRRDMQEVVPSVYLGPYSAASRSKMQTLLDYKITHIVCVRHAIEANIIKPNFLDKFKYLVLDIADTMTENIIQHFQEVNFFIDEGLSFGGCVLIHGNAGISRSAALVLAYVMETYDLSLEEAHRVVQQRRFCINPSTNFMQQLKEYEPIYKARKMLTNNPQNFWSQCNKRTYNQIDSDASIEDKTDDIMDS
ncbi:hypothetical protein HN011_002584 [Eciton burchellii]|nr:hypothetical protein HN011_002584 [Eciton burchellii]